MAAIGWNPKSFRGRHSQSGGRGSLGALGALGGESWCPPPPPPQSCGIQGYLL